MKWLYCTCLFRFFKFKIIRWDPPFLGRTKTEEMHSPGSRVVSTIIAFSSKLEISEVIITCSCPLKRFPGGGCLWEGWVLNSIYRPDTIWRISVCVVICCQAGINCLSLLLLKELLCATRYPINVGTKPTKSVTCNEFSFEAKSSFIFCWAPPFSSTVFASIWAGTGLWLKKGLFCFWRQEGLEEELEPLLWLTAVWIIWFKAWIAVTWAWSSSPNNKVVTGVWEEHKEP